MPGYDDRTGVAKAHLDVANVYTSPLIFGLRICYELVALMEHMFTEEEVELVSHVKQMTGEMCGRMVQRADGSDPNLSLKC